MFQCGRPHRYLLYCPVLIALIYQCLDIGEHTAWGPDHLSNRNSVLVGPLLSYLIPKYYHTLLRF